MVIRAGFNSKLLASIGGCLTNEYSFMMLGLQKSSIVLCLRGFSATSFASTCFSIPSYSAINAFSATLIFFRFLKVLSISVSTRSSSDFVLLCIYEVPEIMID